VSSIPPKKPQPKKSADERELARAKAIIARWVVE
jgi:hypothetical protein